MLKTSFIPWALVVLAAAPAGADQLAPSPARLSPGRLHTPDEIAGSARCGDSGCHPDITAQWRSSVHHQSSFNNPFYRATVDALLAEPDGVAKARWCAGCHDPALLFTGGLTEDLDREGELAQEGIGCLVCHAMDDDLDRRGNGGFGISEAAHLPTGPLANLRLRLRPGRHRDAMLRSFHATSEFCLRCHKVSVPPEVNGDHWRRGQNEYDTWHQSGVSGNSVSSFYRRPTPVGCIDCHMPMVESNDQGHDDGQVRSHRFAAANYALAFLNQDSTQFEAVAEFLRRGTMRIDVMGVELEGGTLQAPASAATGLTPGQRVRLFVVVRNRNVGHEFPGGTIDSHEAWIELTVRDADGRTILSNGTLREDDGVDPTARVYRARLLTADGDLVQRRDVQHWKATALRTVIGPGQCDVARYSFTLPSDAPLPITVDARLRYRKFNPAYSDWVFRDQTPPDLPILTVAETTAQIPGRARDAPRELGERFNDLGIGLFLQDDLRRARAAFRRVQELWPSEPDGTLNLIRVALAEGNLDAAGAGLDRADAMAGSPHPTYRWLRARWEAASGRTAEAVRLLGSLIADYPEDRGLRHQLADLQLQLDQPGEALRNCDAILSRDPEHLGAWSLKLTALRRLGRPTQEAETAVAFYKAHETERALVGNWLRDNPLENRASQVRWEARAEGPE